MAVLLNITRIVPIPHEPGQVLTVKRLSPGQLRLAAEAHTDKSLATFRRMGGAAFLAELKAMGDMGDKKEAAVDPLEGHDADTLIQNGLIGWSYNVEFTPEHVALLDDATAAFAAQSVLDYAKNRLSEAERGNA